MIGRASRIGMVGEFIAYMQNHGAWITTCEDCLLYTSGCQRWIYVLQPVRDILVDRALAYPKFLRRLPHRGIVVYDVIGNGNGPLFDIILQKKTPQNSFLQSMKNLSLIHI